MVENLLQDRPKRLLEPSGAPKMSSEISEGATKKNVPAILATMELPTGPPGKAPGRSSRRRGAPPEVPRDLRDAEAFLNLRQILLQ